MQLQTRTTEVVNEKMEKGHSYCFLEMENDITYIEQCKPIRVGQLKRFVEKV